MNYNFNNLILFGYLFLISVILSDIIYSSSDPRSVDRPFRAHIGYVVHGLTLLGLEKRDLHDGDDLLCLYDTQYGNEHEHENNNENRNNHENEIISRIENGGSGQHEIQNSTYGSAVADRNVQTSSQTQSIVRTSKDNIILQPPKDQHTHLRSYFQEGICVPFTQLSGPWVNSKILDIKESCTYMHDNLAATIISLFATSVTRGQLIL